MFAEPALINYQLIWRVGGVKGGVWAVGGRSFLINVSNHSKRTLLRVIQVNSAWHIGCLLLERMSGSPWDGEVGGERVSSK